MTSAVRVASVEVRAAEADPPGGGFNAGLAMSDKIALKRSSALQLAVGVSRMYLTVASLATSLYSTNLTK